MSTIKITDLLNIGSNIAYTTVIPVVDTVNTPETQKANLQIVGNLILNGAGGSYFTRAAQANIALSVANAAQPNITSVGTLTTLTVSGNIVSGNISTPATGSVKTTATIYANLVSASTAGAGSRSFITDANLVASSNFGALVSGGGSNSVPVYSDGTNWRIG